MSNVAYVKPITVGGRTYQSIYAADGTPLSITADRDNAFALVRQNHMKPTSVH
ncbi:MAG: DUF1150 family protein [Alphaproteobacteria bacterium]|nr:DUF1150 family protein [Alphaproteobacteria bacterium]